MRDFKVIGLMSGSSLDGVDIAYVNFSHDNKKWFFQIVEAGNVPYPEYWKEQLSSVFNKDKEEIKQNWQLGKAFEPVIENDKRSELLKGWKRAVKCALLWAGEE